MYQKGFLMDNQDKDNQNLDLQQQENVEVKKEEQEESAENINWKKFREAREQERKARELAEKRAREKEEEAAALKAAMEALVDKPGRRSREDEFYDGEEEDEDAKLQKKLDKLLQERETVIERKRQEQEQKELPMKLAQAYNDFEKVCTSENLDYLEYHYPELATPFKHMPDSFEKWSSLYKAIKRFIPNMDSQKDAKKAEKNLKSPQSISSPGKVPSSDQAPTYLDEQRRKDNWARMQRIMKSG